MSRHEGKVFFDFVNADGERDGRWVDPDIAAILSAQSAGLAMLFRQVRELREQIETGRPDREGAEE